MLGLPLPTCEVHGTHWPPVREPQVHHVWPRGMGGPDAPTLPDGTKQKVTVCPTGHVNIHRAIRQMLRGQAASGTRAELELARSGISSWIDSGRPGKPE